MVENYKNVDISSTSLRRPSAGRDAEISGILTAKVYTHIDFTLTQKEFPLEQAVFRENIVSL